jgi:hypothetical protein
MEITVVSDLIFHAFAAVPAERMLSAVKKKRHR